VGTNNAQSPGYQPVQAKPEPRVPGRLKRRIHIAPDFEEPLPDQMLAAFRGEKGEPEDSLPRGESRPMRRED
jgi:hypothetical protein